MSVFMSVNSFIISIVAIYSSTINQSLLFIILIVANLVLINAIDYLGIIDIWLFLGYICLFQFSMIVSILTNDTILCFINWDLLGLISYLLINYWINKVNSGIKAIIYNKIGDMFFLLWLVILYELISNNNYYCFLYLYSVLRSVFFRASGEAILGTLKYFFLSFCYIICSL